MMDAPTKSGVKRKTASSSQPSTMDAPLLPGCRRETESLRQFRRLTPQERWKYCERLYHCLPRSYLKKGGWMSPEGFSDYLKKVNESEGFDVSGCSGHVSNGIVELREKSCLRGAVRAAKYAVERHNTDTGAKLKFIEVVKANFSLAALNVYYITLRALNERDEPKIYRAKVLHDDLPGTPPDGEYILEIFKLAPGEREGVDGGDELKMGKSNKIKRPFHIFMDELKKHSEFANERYFEVMRAARIRWDSFSPEEKAGYEEKVASGLLTGVKC